ncbi:MAG: dCTP deaminase [Helicobacter sp.]|nr:dCTP deaminase [Helicobacter sp.]
MVLATSELQKIAHNITALNDYNIRGASIDLSLGDTAKIQKDDTEIDLFTLDDGLINEDIYEEVDLAKGYPLLPQTYLYASSVEQVSIPNNMCGIVLPRSSFARIGLILPISLYANPGYVGHLPIVIFNASRSVIKIPPYIRIMQLLFLETKGTSIPYGKYEDSKYQDEDALALPKFNDKELKDILDRIKKA